MKQQYQTEKFNVHVDSVQFHLIINKQRVSIKF